MTKGSPNNPESSQDDLQGESQEFSIEHRPDASEDQTGYQEVTPKTQCGQISISKQEYDELQHWAEIGSGRSSFWTEALYNVDGAKVVIQGAKEIADLITTKWLLAQGRGVLYSSARLLLITLILGVIIYVAYNLALSGVVDSSTVVFLLGTLTGYLLTFLTKVELPGDR